MTLLGLDTPARIHRGPLWGVDHGQRDNKILIDSDTAKLIWSPGGSYWSGMAGNRYSPSHLGIYRKSQRFSNRMSSLYDGGGRLTSSLLQSPEVRAAIVAEFGERAANLVHPKNTVNIPS